MDQQLTPHHPHMLDTTDFRYSRLTDQGRRLHQLLALTPVPQVSLNALLALDERPAVQVREDLHIMVGLGLLERTDHGYRQPPHAREHAARLDDDASPARRQARARVLAWYVHTAATAATALDPTWRHPRLPPHVPGHDRFAPDRALSWFEDHLHHLVAALTLARANGLDSLGWQLHVATAPYLRLTHHHRVWEPMLDTATHCAERVTDPHGRAALTLDRALLEHQRHPHQARPWFKAALHAWEGVEETSGRAQALIEYAYALLTSDRDRALDLLKTAETLIGRQEDLVQRWQGHIKVARGLITHAQGHARAAEMWFEAALSWQSTPPVTVTLPALLGMVAVHLDTARPDRAAHVLHRADLLLDRCPGRERAASVDQARAHLYRHLGDLDRARLHEDRARQLLAELESHHHTNQTTPPEDLS